MAIPQEVIDAITAAESAMDDAAGKDQEVATAQKALAAAQGQIDTATANALAAHQSASQAAANALTVLKNHLGITT